jgi:hypothetical protein
MSESTQAPAEQTVDASGKTEKPSETVAYDTYRKSVNAEKNAKARAAELEAELQKIKQEKDLADGNKDKVISELMKKAETLENEFKKTKSTYAWSALTGEIKRTAAKHGCKDPEKLIKLMDDEDFNSIEVGEDFSIKQETLENVINKSKKENHFLFDSSNKIAAPGKPGTAAPNRVEKTEAQLFDEYIKGLK